MKINELAKEFKKLKEYNRARYQFNSESEAFTNFTKEIKEQRVSEMGYFGPVLFRHNMEQRLKMLNEGVYPETFEGLMNWINDGRPSVKKLKLK